MHHPWRFATVVAAALAFTACADSLPRGITEPDGLRPTHLSGSVSPALDEVFHKAEALLNDLYACAGTRQIGNKNSDLFSVSDFAAAGKWDQVVSGVNKIIKDTDDLIAKQKGGIPSSCAAGGYFNATQRAALRDEVVFWLNVFANQGDFDGGDEGASFSCPAGTVCDEQTTGPNGYGFTGKFDNDVLVVIRPYTKAVENSVGNKFDFSLLGGQSIGPWIRWICWNGFIGSEDVSPNPDNVVMIRIANEGTVDEFEDFLPTEWEDTRCVQQSASLNPILKGAYKLFAGLPFLPSTAEAYLPPRTFGGSGTAASPHFLRVLDEDDPFDALCLATFAISPPTANAGCGFLVKASQCTTASCTNSNLDQYIHVVEAAVPQKISAEDAATLTATAEGLKQTP